MASVESSSLLQLKMADDEGTKAKSTKIMTSHYANMWRTICFFGKSMQKKQVRFI